MEKNKKNELIEMEVEQKRLEDKTSAYQAEIANELINGLGDEIKRTLNNPVKITKVQILKLKIKDFFKRIFDAL